MKKFYRCNERQKLKHRFPIHINYTDTKISVVHGEKIVDLTYDYLRSRSDNTPFARYFFVTEVFSDYGAITDVNKFLLDITGEVFNMHSRTRRTKQSADEYQELYNVNLPLSIVLQPNSFDFSEVDIAIHAHPDDVITANGIEIDVIKRGANRKRTPKFKIEGANSIKANTIENYTVGFIDRASGEIDTLSNFRIVLNTNIGVLNKKDVYLKNGIATVSLNTFGLNSGDIITLEAGIYEYSNTSQLQITVI